MKKVQKIAAVLLAALLLVSSGVSGVASVSAVDVKGAETTEVKTREPETVQAKSGGSPETDTEAGAQQTETGKETEAESGETEETQEILPAETETGETEKRETEQRDTEKNGTEKGETERITEKQEETEAPKKAVRTGGGVTITSADDPALVALIPDEDEEGTANFRAAVYKSLAAYGWLSGDPENPPSSVQEILETYGGGIDARRCGIKSIEGIQYLKMATTDDEDFLIDLRYNEITNLMPLVSGGDYHYGKRMDNGSVRPVQINVSHNPIICFPDTIGKWKLGYVDFARLTNNATEIVKSDTLKYYYLRKENQKFSGYMQVGYCRYEDEKNGEFIEISRMELNGVDITNTESTPITIQQTDQGKNKSANADVYYSNLMKSMQCKLAVFTTEFIRSHNWDELSGDNTDTTGYQYPLYPSFTIFDHLTVTGDSKGSARVYKTDKITGKPLAGAVFDLFREGEDTPVQSGLVTGAYGYTETVTGLPKGNYYFKETKAPEGYGLSQEVYKCSVGYSAAVDGGLKSLDYTSADESKVQAKAGDRDTYITWKMENDVDFYIQDGAGENMGNGGDAVESVKLIYSSLNGGDRTEEKYENLEQAEKGLMAHIRNNDITGEVTAEVTYKEEAIPTVTVEAVNEPVVDVQIDKKWKGIDGGDKDFPEVTYTLYRTGEDGKEEEAAVHTVPAGSGEAAYSYRFRNLPKYGKNSDGAFYEYRYRAEETITQQETSEYLRKYMEEGEIGEASKPEKQKDGSELITIPVTNFRKAVVIVNKSDASGEKTDLSGVEFGLEKEIKKDGKTVWETVETEEGKTRFVTDEKGSLEIKWLAFGKYRLTETKTWGSYILLEKPLVFEITRDNIQTPNEIVYMISNHYKYDVPRSGGIGSILFFVSGGLLLLAGGLWLYKRRVFAK